MEKLFYEMFENGFFSDIFFVDENPAKIEIEKIYKENGEIIKETINHEFVLSRYVNNFTPLNGSKDIKSIGVFMDQYYNTSVYQKPYNKYDEDIIFLGNYDSITPVINKNIISKDNKSFIEYKFEITGDIRKIILH